MQSAYAYVKAIARKFRNPTWFVTYTSNPKWPEITTLLNEKESALNRHNVMCPVDTTLLQADEANSKRFKLVVYVKKINI